MNTEEVVAMIDAITEGRYYAHSFETTPNSNTISIEVGTNNPEVDSEFWFSTFDEGVQFLAKINDPRVAREIAGALVAWANKQEGVRSAKPREISESEWQSSGTLRRKVRNGCWREDWYRRNVGNMSQETKDRNLRDLKGMLNLGDESPEQLDIDAAINILLENGAKDNV